MAKRLYERVYSHDPATDELSVVAKWIITESCVIWENGRPVALKTFDGPKDIRDKLEGAHPKFVIDDGPTAEIECIVKGDAAAHRALLTAHDRSYLEQLRAIYWAMAVTVMYVRELPDLDVKEFAVPPLLIPANQWDHSGDWERACHDIFQCKQEHILKRVADMQDRMPLTRAPS